MASARSVVFTLNNFTETELKGVLDWACSYLVVGEEVGESGTPHLQGYVEWGRSVRFTTMKNLNNRIHWEKRKGTAKQAADYCKKGEQSKAEWEEHNVLGPNYGKNAKVHELGEISSQGERKDLDEVKEAILSGRKVDDIVLEQPMLFHQYGRTLNKIEDLAMRKKYRNFMTKGIWYYGPTGVGKSHAAFEGYTPETHYVLPNDREWCDGYTQQETVIINDFRGHIKYEELLMMVDKWPYTLCRRGREPLPFMSKTVIITSSLSPEQVYHRRHAEDSLKQFYDRFTVIHMDGESKRKPCGVAQVVGGNTTTPTPTTVEPEFELDEELKEFLSQ